MYVTHEQALIRRKDIYVDPERNARRTMNKGAIEELKSSIANKGLLHNIGVRRIDEKGKPPYKLVYGYRRLAALTAMQIPLIPAMIVDADEARAYEMMMEENIIREDVDPWDLGDAIVIFRNAGLTYPDIAERLSLALDESFTMSRLQRLAETCLNLAPDLRELWKRGTTDFGEAEAYKASLLSKPEQLRLFDALTGGEPRPFSLPRPEAGGKRKAGRPKMRSLERALQSLRQHEEDDHDDGLQNHDQRKGARLVLQWALGARSTSPIKMRPKAKSPKKEDTES